jgi:hypothetical protein
VKSPRSRKVPSFLVDLAHPLPVGYFLLLHREGAQLLRVRGRQAQQILECTGPTSSLESLVEVWKAIRASSFYHGQPIAVLLNNERVWFFHKRYDSRQVTIVASDLKAMASGDVITNHVIKHEKSGLRVTAQGIDRAYLDQVQRSASVADFTVAFTTSLPAYLFANGHLGLETVDEIRLLDWSTEMRDFVVTKKNGTCSYGKVPPTSLDTLDLSRSCASVLFFGGESAPKSVTYCLKPKPGQRSVAELFKAGIAVPKECRPLFKDSPVSKTVWAAQVMSNSLRLLICIFSVIAVFATSAFVLTRRSGVNPADDTGKYQAIYSDHLELRRTVDSLKSLVPFPKVRNSPAGEPAAILSTFCQQKVPGLWLNGLTVRRTASDSVSIEAVGMARNSQAVFALQKSVVDQPGSFPIALVSLHPEVVSMGGQSDTVQSFKFGASIFEGKGRE